MIPFESIESFASFKRLSRCNDLKLLQISGEAIEFVWINKAKVELFLTTRQAHTINNNRVSHSGKQLHKLEIRGLRPQLKRYATSKRLPKLRGSSESFIVKATKANHFQLYLKFSARCFTKNNWEKRFSQRAKAVRRPRKNASFPSHLLANCS